MSESGNPYRLIDDDSFVLSAEVVETMREQSKRDAVKPPLVEEQADLMLGFLSDPRKS